MNLNEIPAEMRDRVRRGCVIPAHPLALGPDRRFDARRHRALTRYYIDAGAGGLAVGVHTTQFAIREPRFGLFETVLERTAVWIDEWCASKGGRILKIAGVCGRTEQARREAEFARDRGYQAVLLSLSDLGRASVADLIRHCRVVAGVMPLVGFYLQPAVGGRALPFEFWRRFAEIENVLAIKVAPFDRYQTLDVVRAVCEAEREHDIALYTGNDDNIVVDLLTGYRFPTRSGVRRARLVGGLLGQWSVWTRSAVELLERIHEVHASGAPIPPALLTRGMQLTDANAAIFDAANGFAGCLPGIHEVLRRQGLLAGTWCLDPDETLSPGQKEEIDRVCDAYPALPDDEFVRAHLDEWLAA